MNMGPTQVFWMEHDTAGSIDYVICWYTIKFFLKGEISISNSEQWLTLVEIFSPNGSVCISSFNVRLHPIGIISFDDFFEEFWCVFNRWSSNELCIRPWRSNITSKRKKTSYYTICRKTKKLKKFTKALTEANKKCISCSS